MSIITTALGLVLVFLILSLLASSVQEAIASWFSLRGRTFGEAIGRMLINVKAEDGKTPELDESLLQKFKNHTIFRQLLPQKGWYHYSHMGTDKHPSYMSPSTFSEILMHVMKAKDMDSLKSYVGEMNDGELKTYLLDLIDDADNDINVFREKLEDWYGDIMDRATGWYKRHVHNILLVIGIVLAILLNADTFSVYSKVSAIQAGSPEEEALFSMAQGFVDTKGDTYISQLNSFRKAVDSLQNVPDSLRDLSNLLLQDSLLQQQRDTLINDLSGPNSPLGLGWTPEEWKEFKEGSWYVWLIKLLGVLITTLAISLGAPFWFDILKKIVNVRNAGVYNAGKGQNEKKA